MQLISAKYADLVNYLYSTCATATTVAVAQASTSTIQAIDQIPFASCQQAAGYARLAMHVHTERVEYL